VITAPGETLLQFPTQLTLRAIGHDAGQPGSLRALVTAAVEAHTPPEDRQQISQRPSSQGKYVAVAATFTARSQAQLEAIYGALYGHPQVLMLL
jgi:hypothetical protein